MKSEDSEEDFENESSLKNERDPNGPSSKNSSASAKSTGPESDKLFTPHRSYYSPKSIAVFTLLGSFLVGFILYGENLKRRGQVQFGNWLILLCGIALTVFVALPFISFIEIPSDLILQLRLIWFLGSLVAAVILYRNEQTCLSLEGSRVEKHRSILFPMILTIVINVPGAISDILRVFEN